jgi:nucleoside 2-deoxyribosyltransferase
MSKIYLAGPDVFLPNAIEVGRRKKEICREFGFEGLFPLDNEFPGEPSGAKIYRANLKLIERAEIGLFNLSPFRGPSADAGTVFELGLMRGLNKRLFGYRNCATFYDQRVIPDDYAIEKFGLGDNLMIDCALGQVHEAPEDDLAAFAAFRQALTTAWQTLHGSPIG